MSAAGTGWSFSTSGPIVTATLAGAIAAGDSSLLTLTAAVAPLAFPSVINAAVATTANDPVPANDRDVDPTAVTGVGEFRFLVMMREPVIRISSLDTTSAALTEGSDAAGVVVPGGVVASVGKLCSAGGATG